jgi:2-haloacid dehalogenase
MSGTATGAPTTVVWDIGGVFLDWNPRHLYRKLIEDEAAMEDFLATVCTNEWNVEQDRGRDWDLAVAELAAEHPDKAELIAAFHLRWEETVAGPVPGTKEILEDLAARGVPQYAITNFSSPKFAIAREAYPELKRFAGIVVSGDLRLIKPDPAIYRALLDAYAIEPSSALFVDDSPKNVDGARAVGMHAVRFVDAPTLRRDLEGFGLL